MDDKDQVSPTQYQGSDGIISSMPPSAPRSQPPPRWITGASPGGGGGQGLYRGVNLVGLNNTVERAPYDITEEYVRTQYGDIRAEDRSDLFLTLDKYGFLTGDPNNFTSQLNGLANLLDYANTMGITAERALEEIKRGQPVKPAGGGGVRRYRVTSPEDLKVVAKRMAQETIGRSFTEDEANQFVAAYQQREVQAQKQYFAGGVATEAPSADVFAQQFAQQIAPTEANGYKFLGFMDSIFRSIGGR
jgi:hypothetical protein